MAARGRHDPDPEAERAASDFIRANLPLTAVPGTGVHLHLASPRSGLSRLVPPGGTPYWAHAWPGGVALATHLARHPELVRNRSAVEIGAGSGLVAIAAAVHGASDVVALDTDPLAAVATRLNAEANGVGRQVRAMTGPRKPHRDQSLVPAGLLAQRDPPILLVADLFYDATLAAHVARTLDAQPPHALTLVGDIGRPFLPRDRLEPLAAYPVRDLGDPPSAPLREGWVFRWVSRP
ncbi:class I SAM-dependent methyltransferase [Rubellimicrobium roseum]|uniref:Methyltransferase n=1 Tax=Rubellimicrobium roseum TaxID=687525 RepID=A0A5C4N8I0_9RHOB|nr:50S ribosomal protein L11 methyltransferase [Rubellimicrobium roseum]TNC70865.1 methyltransferase [Rubellimicrobium roseum]